MGAAQPGLRAGLRRQGLLGTAVGAGGAVPSSSTIVPFPAPASVSPAVRCRQLRPHGTDVGAQDLFPHLCSRVCTRHLCVHARVSVRLCVHMHLCFVHVSIRMHVPACAYVCLYAGPSARAGLGWSVELQGSAGSAVLAAGSWRRRTSWDLTAGVTRAPARSQGGASSSQGPGQGQGGMEGVGRKGAPSSKAAPAPLHTGRKEQLASQWAHAHVMMHTPIHRDRGLHATTDTHGATCQCMRRGLHAAHGATCYYTRPGAAHSHGSTHPCTQTQHSPDSHATLRGLHTLHGATHQYRQMGLHTAHEATE